MTPDLVKLGGTHNSHMSQVPLQYLDYLLDEYDLENPALTVEVGFVCQPGFESVDENIKVLRHNLGSTRITFEKLIDAFIHFKVLKVTEDAKKGDGVNIYEYMHAQKYLIEDKILQHHGLAIDDERFISTIWQRRFEKHTIRDGSMRKRESFFSF